MCARNESDTVGFPNKIAEERNSSYNYNCNEQQVRQESIVIVSRSLAYAVTNPQFRCE